ncbi:MAG: glycosyltransferase [Verrucomicrobiota bacterium]
MPRVSIILPVHNGKTTLPKTVESVLVQSYQDWELLVYDDGSTDGTVEYLQSLTDPRVRVYLSETNYGYAKWLNVGLIEATGEYLARLDADDICMPSRLRRQADALDENEQLVLVGCNTQWIDSDDREIQVKKYPKHNVAIRWELLCDNPFCHPGVMMRGDVIRQHQLSYREDLLPSEDYGLWTELLQYGEGTNLQQVLLKYRIHTGQISHEKRSTQLEHHDQVVEKELGRWLAEMPDCTIRVALRQIWQGGLLRDLSQDVDWFKLHATVIALFHRFEKEFGAEEVEKYAQGHIRAVWRRLYQKAAMLEKIRLTWVLVCARFLYKSGRMFS